MSVDPQEVKAARADIAVAARQNFCLVLTVTQHSWLLPHKAQAGLIFLILG